MKKQLLLLSSLFLLSLSACSIVRMDNSDARDSIKSKNYLISPSLLSDSVVNFGKVFLNTPYRYGSSGVSSFDCSGFTSHVYRNFGYNLERSSVDQARQFDTIDRTQLKTGDLVFFSGRHKSKTVGHVGIVVSANENGDFNFIHSAVHRGVTISNSKEEYYTKRFIKASRVISNNITLAITKLIKKGEKPFLKEELASKPVSKPVSNPVQTIKRVIPAEYHPVTSGETLSSISKKYGMTVAQLKQINNLKENKLSLKQQILVKAEETVVEVQTVQSPVANKTLLADNTAKVTNQSVSSHSVKKGESLFSISRLYNMSVDELKSINSILKGKIHPGQRLKISQSKELAKNEPSAVTVQEDSKPSTHKVISGETLFSISKTQNVSVEELKKINNISNSKIHLGQELKLSQNNEKAPIIVAETESKQDLRIKNNEKTITHTIKKGESLLSIAKNNNVTVEELKKLNNLSDSKIRSGQKLKLTQSVEESKIKPEKLENIAKNIQHIVKSGESFYSIARNYGCTINELKSWNQKSGNKIKVGDNIIILKTITTQTNSVAQGAITAL